MAFLQFQATFMPRFKKSPKPKGVIGFGSKKTGAKRSLYASIE